MPIRFQPNRAYQSHLDVRLIGCEPPSWAQPLIEGRPPNATCWLVVMPRRAGKTWLASGIAHLRPPGATQRIDLRATLAIVKKAGLHCLVGGTSPPRPTGDLILIDEPGVATSGTTGVDPAGLALGLAKLRSQGAVPIVFAAPSDHALLIPHLSSDATKDIVLPPPLNDSEIARIADRQPDWAPATVRRILQIDPSWLQTAFLLELLLHLAEEHISLRDDPQALVDAAVDEAESRHDYLRAVFNSGLAASQRAELRSGRWQNAGIEMPLANRPRLLANTQVRDDPILANHLPEVLRIHHISDLHHGGNLRANVDAKDTSETGRRLAALAGAGTPLDSYLRHVHQLADDGRAPHLVIITGDLVNRPHNPFGDQALSWLAKLKTTLAGHRNLCDKDPRILLVGGNHDVSWERSLDPEREARHCWFADIFADYPHPDLHLSNEHDRRLFVKYPHVGLRVALLGSAESGGEAANDRDRALLKAFSDKLQENIDENAVRDLVRTFERIDPGIVARPVLDRLTTEDGYLTFAALHHPLSPVPAVEVAPYSGIVNAGQVKRALLLARTALVLHGHTHLAFLSAERILAASSTWTVRIAGAPTLASAASDEQNGYNEIFVAREGGCHSIAVRLVRLDGGQWLPQPTIAFHPGVPSECPLTELTSDSVL